ncbi:hypothetical protein [Microvirga pudoricolor]|uniref:hypothetical protein n=1 Tax=Microvirga pudoricolor TaxID=2778729 RepID=UPI00195198CF|nr:hypothetical protein [Microvirga pudoricolor]MBM6594661.1 hypothetical protein [Microvirga pudoricolor]
MRRLVLKASLILALAFAANGSVDAAPQQNPAQSWPEVKCARYKDAWIEALKRFGTKGLSQDFIATHEAFLASGCTSGDVCPRSAEELDLANVMVIRAMNAGTASTFPPFRCRKP